MWLSGKILLDGGGNRKTENGCTLKCSPPLIEKLANGFRTKLLLKQMLSSLHLRLGLVEWTEWSTLSLDRFRLFFLFLSYGCSFPVHFSFFFFLSFLFFSIFLNFFLLVVTSWRLTFFSLLQPYLYSIQINHIEWSILLHLLEMPAGWKLTLMEMTFFFFFSSLFKLSPMLIWPSWTNKLFF